MIRSEDGLKADGSRRSIESYDLYRAARISDGDQHFHKHFLDSPVCSTTWKVIVYHQMCLGSLHKPKIVQLISIIVITSREYLGRVGRELIPSELEIINPKALIKPQNFHCLTEVFTLSSSKQELRPFDVSRSSSASLWVLVASMKLNCVTFPVMNFTIVILVRKLIAFVFLFDEGQLKTLPRESSRTLRRRASESDENKSLDFGEKFAARPTFLVSCACLTRWVLRIRLLIELKWRDELSEIFPDKSLLNDTKSAH